MGQLHIFVISKRRNFFVFDIRATIIEDNR